MMGNNVLISIIIPAYNLEDYLGSTLDALLLDDLSAVEIIVIDDGSSDDTFTVATSKLDGKDINCQVVRQVNAGVSAARNHGLSLANGEYIHFLDGDDIVKNGCFTKIKQVLKDHKYDLVSFGYDIVDESGKTTQLFEEMYCYPEKDLSIDEFIPGLIHKKYGVRIGSVVLKKSIVDSNGLKFNIDSRYGEDVEFLYKYIILSSDQYYIKSSHFNYLLRESSAMATRRLQIFDPVHAYDRVYEYFLEHEGSLKVSRLIKSVSIPESVVRCIIRGIRDGQLQVGLGGHLPDGMKERLQGVRYMALDLSIAMLTAIFLLIHFPGLFALILKK